MRPQRMPIQLVERGAAKAGGLAEKGIAVGQRTSHFTLMGGGTRWG